MSCFCSGADLQSIEQRDQQARWGSGMLSLDWPENTEKESCIWYDIKTFRGFTEPSSVISTCCDTLDREEPLCLRVSPWHTVSKELGMMERKSLKDRRCPDSPSSAVVSRGATGRGNSLESNGSSVLLYLPKARATPSRVGTVYLHRYSMFTERRVTQGS